MEEFTLANGNINMHTKTLLIATGAAMLPASAFAQEAPDGSNAFGFEPYVAVGGGYDEFDRKDEIDSLGIDDPTQGAFIEGTVGANRAARPRIRRRGRLRRLWILRHRLGIWRSGPVSGVRVGESGMFYYGRVGYMWIEGENDFNDDDGDFIDTDEGPSRRDRDGVFYGIGAEVGPEDIGLGGITGQAGPRLRFGVDTFKDFESFRPSASVVFQF